MSHPSASTIALREAARAEVALVSSARAAQLAAMLRSGLSAEEIGQTRDFAAVLGGPLRSAWLAFIESSLESQLDALAGPAFCDMPWHSLLQCNPYGRLTRWKPVASHLRPEGERRR